MARRLVAAGIPFVEVLLKGWDTHENNFPRVTDLSATLDQGMSALLDDLGKSGLLDSTLVLWMGDFGRTPVINVRGGRDHFPTASNIVLAGGGVKGGQVIGATNDNGDEIVTRPVSVPDLYRSVAWAMQVDADKTRFAPSGRPVKTVDGGAVISEAAQGIRPSPGGDLPGSAFLSGVHHRPPTHRAPRPRARPCSGGPTLRTVAVAVYPGRMQAATRCPRNQTKSRLPATRRTDSLPRVEPTRPHRAACSLSSGRRPKSMFQVGLDLRGDLQARPCPACPRRYRRRLRRRCPAGTGTRSAGPERGRTEVAVKTR